MNFTKRIKLSAKKFIKCLICIYFIIYINLNSINVKNIKSIEEQLEYNFPKYKKIIKNLSKNNYEKYINDCKSKKNFNRTRIKNEFPLLSICICNFNSEKYVEDTIVSIINQSFQDFEVIIIDDYSNDNSLNILKKYQIYDDRIRIINHSKNYGIYRSRVDAIFNSIGEYILFVDADDMLLNEYILEIIYFYISIYHFDIIEFLVLYLVKEKKLVFPPSENQVLTHIHNYSENIIYQPELSNIIFYIPRTKIYSSVICRILWNKVYKRKIFLDSIKYIGTKFYFKSYLNYGEDTILNILNFRFASNYTNINLYGYMYNIRKNSISRFNKDIRKRRVLNLGIYYYILLLYKYIKEFGIDREILYQEIKLFNKQIEFCKKKTPNFFKRKIKTMLNKIIKDKKASIGFKNYIKKLLKY